MLKVFKYDLSIDDIIGVDLPKGAEVLTVQAQRELPRLWALVDPSEKATEKRVFRMVGTGHPIVFRSGRGQLKYISTVQMRGGDLIFHFFEVQ